MSKAVLCLDDEEEVCELIEHFLRHHRVIATHHPYVALDLLAREHFDLAIVDLHLPVIDGIEVCRRIKAIDETIPVVVCSGRATDIDRLDAQRAGVSRYFVKPIDPVSFQQCIEHLLSLSEFPTAPGAS
jgi:CheY-like chemotaxis protein